MIFCAIQEEVEKIVEELSNLYKLRRSEEVEFFSKVRLRWTYEGKGDVSALQLSQEVYVDSVLRRLGMDSCKSAVTLMVEKIFEGYEAEKDKSQINAQLYQQIIDLFFYLGLRSRPDILDSVWILPQFQKCPTACCHRSVKRVPRYLKGTCNHAVTYRKGTTNFSIFVDYDYACDTEDRNSMTGYVVKIGDALVSWKAKKQMSVALSTCEAEYFALSIACQEVV